MKNFFKNYLVFRLSALGDIVLTTGILNYWHNKYGINFSFITRQECSPVLENMPGIDQIISVQKKDLQFKSWLQFIKGLKQNQGQYPLIDLHGNLRSQILKQAWPQKCYTYHKMGLQRRIFQKLSLQVSGKPLLKLNVPQRYSLALTKKAPPAEKLIPKIYLTDKEHAWAKNQIQNLGLRHPLVAIHPYATHRAKTWPRARWLGLIEKIEKKGWQWIIIGRDKQPLLPQSPQDLTSKTNLRQTCALLQAVDIALSGDSGPMHLSTAVGTPVVAIFGPTSRHWGFFPCGKQDIVLEKKFDCRPCSLHGRGQCAYNYKCLQSISIQEVISAMNSSLNHIQL